MTDNYTGGLDLLTDIFIRDLGPHYAPFFKHILSYWNQKQSGNPNILVIFYEDMQRDIRSVIKKIATFLKVDVTDDSVELLAEHTSFKNMKVNPMTNMSHTLKVISAFLYSKQQRIQIGIGWPQSQEIDQSYQKTNEYSNTTQPDV